MLPPHVAQKLCLDGVQLLRDGDPTAMAGWIREHLFGHVLAFWERHAIDPHGGIFTCINDDGTVNSTDKWMWSQWRAVWVFSRVYRLIDPNPKWLAYARGIAAFCRKHAWDARGHHWSLLVSQDGKILRGHESTYVDAFAIQGLLELYLAGGDDDALRLARETADAALIELAGPRDAIPHFPYPIPRGAKPHAVPMIWSMVLAQLGSVAGDERYLRVARLYSDEIFQEFHRADRNLCVEFVALDGGEFPAPVGTAVVPGHVIECMWFQLQSAEQLGLRAERLRLACDQIIRHLEIGWDAAAGGGLLLAIDADGREPVAWNFADAKLWWPHTEALYATLLAWSLDGSTRHLDWYDRLWRFCLDHYVDWENGEWRQKLDRSLAPISGTIALPVKDPFHLPRSLILQLELLRRLRSDGDPAVQSSSANRRDPIA